MNWNENDDMAKTNNQKIFNLSNQWASYGQCYIYDLENEIWNQQWWCVYVYVSVYVYNMDQNANFTWILNKLGRLFIILPFSIPIGLMNYAFIQIKICVLSLKTFYLYFYATFTQLRNRSVLCAKEIKLKKERKEKFKKIILEFCWAFGMHGPFIFYKWRWITWWKFVDI